MEHTGGLEMDRHVGLGTTALSGERHLGMALE